MNRQEHLDWCKARATQYLDNGDIPGAYASFASDMSKHPETENHIALRMGVMLMMGGNLSTESEMRKYISGFN